MTLREAHHGHHHDHGPGAGRDGPSRPAQRRALTIALVANAGFLVAEIIGGMVFNSLALLADAAHMASDVIGLSVALVAMASRAGPPPTATASA